jgi:glucose-6-phosphate 1-dehydrogenase
MKSITIEKLIKAKNSLQTTLKRILDINKQKKKLSYTKTPPELYTRIKTELKLLNKVAEKQAKLVQLYESKLTDKKTG